MKYRLVSDNMFNECNYNIYFMICLIILFLFIYMQTRHNKKEQVINTDKV